MEKEYFDRKIAKLQIARRRVCRSKTSLNTKMNLIDKHNLTVQNEVENLSKVAYQFQLDELENQNFSECFIEDIFNGYRNLVVSAAQKLFEKGVPGAHSDCASFNVCLDYWANLYDCCFENTNLQPIKWYEIVDYEGTYETHLEDEIC